MNLWQYYNGDLKYPDLNNHSHEKEIAKTNTNWAFEYASKHGKDEDLEPAIAKSSYFAYRYACIIKKPFPLGEHEISKRYDLSYRYANEVLKGPFPLGEPAIAKNAMFSYYYAKYVLNKRFLLGEKAIAKNAEYSKEYTKEVLKKDFYLDGKLIYKYKG